MPRILGFSCSGITAGGNCFEPNPCGYSARGLPSASAFSDAPEPLGLRSHWVQVTHIHYNTRKSGFCQPLSEVWERDANASPPTTSSSVRTRPKIHELPAFGTGTNPFLGTLGCAALSRSSPSPGEETLHLYNTRSRGILASSFFNYFCGPSGTAWSVSRTLRREPTRSRGNPSIPRTWRSYPMSSDRSPEGSGRRPRIAKCRTQHS